VDESFCEDMGLPVVEFSVEYPKDMRTDPAQRGVQNYNAFLKMNKKEVQTEAISFGYYTPQGGGSLKENLKKQLLNQALGLYQQMFEMSEVKIENVNFDGGKSLQFE